MAKLLLSCDDYIFRHNDRYYFKNQEWCSFYYRYLRVFENLRIVNRVIEETQLNDSRILIDDSRIEVHPLPIFHGPYQYITKFIATGKAMSNAVSGCDAAILRLPSTVAQRLSRQVIKAGIPYATEVVFDACDGADTASSILEKILWRIIDRQMRSTCSKADGVSCVTEKYLQRRYYSNKENRFESNYSTLDIDQSFFTSPRQFPDHSPMTIAHVDMQIGLHSRKGTDIIIKALSILKKEKGIIVNVCFAGDDWDNSKELIYKYAKEYDIDGQVSCVGFLSRSQLSSFLDKSDLFVLPTKAEGLPRVIIEALAKGMPTITTPASGNPELIPNEYLVSFYDVEMLAQKIERLVSNPQAYEEASLRNFKHSLQYEKTILQERRDAFYSQLKARCTEE